MEEIKLSNNYDIEDFNAIKNRFFCRMKEYNINFEEKDLAALDVMVNALLNKDLDRESYIHVIAGGCGMGKTVLIQEYINYMLEKNDKYGAVIAKERVEDLEGLQNKYQDKYYALYGFNKKDCLMGYQTYNPNLCKICDRESCRVKQNTENAKTFPVIATTHKRVQLADSIPFLRNQLSEYTMFKGNTPVEARRFDLFIDESPEFYTMSEISTLDIEIFYKELDNTFQRKCKNKDKLIKYFRPMIYNLKEIMIEFPNQYFDGFAKKENYNEFTKYEGMFKDNYYGEHFSKCIDVLSVLKYGGKNSGNKILFPSYRALNRLPFNTMVLDATSIIDGNYTFNCRLIRVPETRLFSNFTLNWSKHNNLSMNYYIEHPDFTHKIVDVIREKLADHEKILIVSFEDEEKIYRQLLEREINNGRILLGHVNATKGKNEYSQCTCIFILYNLYKTDDYYIMSKKNELDHVNLDSIIFEVVKKKRIPYYIKDTTEEKKELEVLDILDKYIVRDKSKDIVQELYRIRLREYNFKGVTEAYLFNTDERVVNLVSSFFPDATIVNWKPFNTKRNTPQLEAFKEGIIKEFAKAEPMYTISLLDFRNKYHIGERNFRNYQKLEDIQMLYWSCKVERKGNFLVKI